jgi:hypothetical protein
MRPQKRRQTAPAALCSVPPPPFRLVTLQRAAAAASTLHAPVQSKEPDRLALDPSMHSPTASHFALPRFLL